jgi:pSer/pThr/pTyr-binding forkhead associated (FHA) protein
MEGRTIEIPESGLTLGTHSGCDLVFEDGEVSNRHAQFKHSSGAISLKDLESTNGTHVGGVRTDSRVLQHGEEIRIAAHNLFVFRNTEQPEESFHLTFTGGERGGEDYVLATKGTTLGRDKSCDLVLNSPKISKRHAHILFEGGAFRVRDLGSTNGIQIDGRKVDDHALTHGNRIGIGDYEILFRSSALPRPEQLVLAQFMLVPMGGGEPIPIGKEPIELGQGAHWGRITPEDGRHLLVRTDGYQTVLSHGEVLRFGKQRFRFKNSLLPLEEDPGIAQATFMAMGVAAAVTLALLLTLFQTMGSEDDTDLRNQRDVRASQADTQEKKISMPESQQLELGLQRVANLVQSRDWEAALSSLTQLRSGFKNSENRLRCADRYQRVEAMQEAFSALDRPRPIPADDSRGRAALAELLRQGIQRSHPLGVALWAYENRLLSEGDPFLASYLSKHPEKIALAESIWTETGRPRPDGGLVVHEGKLMGPQDVRKLQEAARAKLQADKEAQQRMRAMIEAREKRKAEQRRIESLYENFSAEVEDLVRTYLFSRAVTEYQKLKKLVATQPLLVQKIDQRLVRLQQMASMMGRLIQAVSNGELRNADAVFGGSTRGKIVHADLAGYKVRFTQGGEATLKWSHLYPKQMADFLVRMPLSPEDKFLLGVFGYEHQLLDVANKHFVDLYNNALDFRPRINQYLQARLGLDRIPEGGFVPYKGVLVTAEERGKRGEGLVRHDGKWVTPEEREKYLAGYTKFKGDWVLKEDAELYAKGLSKYQGKWYTKAEIQKIRSQWEHAWTRTTTHYDIRCNISPEFIDELAVVMEKSYSHYTEYFGREAQRRMKIFAFRTYEDYRNYCIKNGHESNLRAGGFASSANLTGVGWDRTNNTKTFFSTMIHEGSHLFYFSAFPGVFPSSWYAEGIATQFEGHQWNKKKQELTFDHISRRRLPFIQMQIRKKEQFAMKELVGGNALVQINKGPVEASTFYSQCWSIFYYLKNCEVESYKERFLRYRKAIDSGSFSYERMRRGPPPFLDFFQDVLDELETDWKKFVLGLKP